MKKVRQLAHHFFYNIAFVKKMIFLFCIGILVPMIFQQTVYYLETERGIKERMLATVNEALDDKTLKITSVLSETAALEKRYSTNETLYQCLDKKYTKDLDYLIQYQETFQVLFSETNLYPYHIRMVRLYTDNPTLMNGAYVRKTSDMELESLGETLDYVNLYPVKDQTNTYIRTSHETRRIVGTSDSRSLSLIRVFDYYKQHDAYQKLIRVDIECDDLLAILQETNLFENMILTDSNNQVVVALNSYANSGKMVQINPEKIADSGKLLLSRELSNFGLTLYGLYDMSSISKEFQTSRIQSFFLATASILFALGCVYLVAGNISRRLNRLVTQADEIAQGNFIKKAESSTAQDEFGVLEKSMDRMSAQLEDLIEREYKAQVQQAQLERETNQARFLALQSQVNPHFMYNVLCSIALMAQMDGNTDIQKMASNFAGLTQARLSSGGDIKIPLAQELQYAKFYIELQQMRFGNKISYQVSVSDEALLSCLVPKLTLEMLVENAVGHGIEPKEGPGTVRVSVGCTENGALELVVTDDGVGFAGQNGQIQLPLDLPAVGSRHNRVALNTVYQMLKHLYGPEYGIRITSFENSGTKVTILLPKEDSQHVQNSDRGRRGADAQGPLHTD